MYDANSVVKVLESVNTNWLSDGFTHTHRNTSRLTLSVVGTSILILHTLVDVTEACTDTLFAKFRKNKLKLAKKRLFLDVLASILGPICKKFLTYEILTLWDVSQAHLQSKSISLWQDANETEKQSFLTNWTFNYKSYLTLNESLQILNLFSKLHQATNDCR